MMGLLLLGLGINKSMYGPTGAVQGDTTVASTSASASSTTSLHVPPTGDNPPSTGTKPPYPPTNTFRLNPQNYATHTADFRGGRPTTGSGTVRPYYDTRAFGLAVIRMQEDFAGRVSASSAAAMKYFEDHKGAFQRELSLIKDTRKQAIVDKINTDCQTVNQRRTTVMTDMLARLSLILTNVSNRSASAAASGKDTTSVDNAVATAQTAIADAQTVVAAQAGTTCTITITGDSTVKSDVGKGISALQQALQVVYQKVLLARKAVSDAIHALALVTGESLTGITEHSATASGGQK